VRISSAEVSNIFEKTSCINATSVDTASSIHCTIMLYLTRAAIIVAAWAYGSRGFRLGLDFGLEQRAESDDSRLMLASWSPLQIDTRGISRRVLPLERRQCTDAPCTEFYGCPCVRALTLLEYHLISRSSEPKPDELLLWYVLSKVAIGLRLILVFYFQTESAAV